MRSNPFDALHARAFSDLLARRVVYLRGPLQDDAADLVVAQLMLLDSESPEPIDLIVNSPGGVITGMFAIYDTMGMLSAPVNTRCVGLAASAGAFLLSTGTGVRSATENSRIMLHQPLGGVQGTARDIEIQAANIVWMRERINRIVADRCGRSFEEVSADTDRDLWMTAQEALEYGIIDEVVARRAA